jgi:hypothetical protein
MGTWYYRICQKFSPVFPSPPAGGEGERVRGDWKKLLATEVLAKLVFCHPERSEGSRFFSRFAPSE